MPYRSVKALQALPRSACWWFPGSGLHPGRYRPIPWFPWWHVDRYQHDWFADAMLKAMKDPANVGYARLSRVIGHLMPSLHSCLGCFRGWWTALNFSGSGLTGGMWNIRRVLIGFWWSFLRQYPGRAPWPTWKNRAEYHHPLDTAARSLEDATCNEQVLILSNLAELAQYLMAILIVAFFRPCLKKCSFAAPCKICRALVESIPVLGIIATSLLSALIHSSICLFFSRAVQVLHWGSCTMKQRISGSMWWRISWNNLLALTQLFFCQRPIRKWMLKDRSAIRLVGWCDCHCRIVLFIQGSQAHFWNEQAPRQ